jgi:hypothetical protein
MDVNYRVIGIDPGGTTGWAVYSAYRILVDKKYVYTNEHWTCGQLGPEKHHQALEQLLGLQRVETYVVVTERFTDRIKQTAVNLMAREYIGVVEKYCQEEGVELVMQSSSQAKGFTRPPNLKRLGLYVYTKKHAMDAYKHVLWYLINGRPKRDTWLERGWPND